MKLNELRKVLVVLILVLCLMPIGAIGATFTVGTGGNVDALDNALDSASSGTDTIVLLSDIDSTLYSTISNSNTGRNETNFTKSVSITSQGHRIRVNNTIGFNGRTGTTPTITFNDPATFVYKKSTTSWFNASLMLIQGTGVTITGRNITLDPMDYNAVALNITGHSNTINNEWIIWNATNVSTPANPYAINLSNNGNIINVNAGSFNATTRGINLVDGAGGGNTLQFNSANISVTSATGVKVFLENTAANNVINDVNFAGSNLPKVYIYNGTGTQFHTTSAWYFYNRSWSYDWMNMNVTINVSNSIPIAGNLGIVANWSNVTYPYTSNTANINNVYSNKTNLEVSGGYTGGLSLNTTENTIFNGEFPAMIPVNISFGNNHFGGEYKQLNVGYVYILNFNPINSTTLNSGKFNWTGTTNWTTIPDFTDAQNVTFVVDSGSPIYNLYGNLSFIDPLNLTDPSTGSALSRLGTALAIPNTGCSIKMDTTTATGVPAMNKAAILQVYPSNFNFTVGSTNIKVTADGNEIYNNGVWNRQGYVSNTATLTVGNANITLPVLHFTTYNFGTGSTTPSSPSVDNGGGSSPPSAVQQQQLQQQIVAETHTVSVNVGGNSAITAVAVTGTGINDLIVTALPETNLPASITPPSTPVFQYMSVTPARYSTISGVTFNFNVPASYLADKGYSKNDMVLTVWEPETKTWTSLPTTIVSEKEGQITYQATGATHMSEFAIVYQKGAASQAAVNVTPIQTSVPVTATTTQTIVTTVATTRPVTTATPTVAPTVTQPPKGGLPTTTIAIVVVAIIVIIAAAFLVHRWWVRKQNPALFKDLK